MSILAASSLAAVRAVHEPQVVAAGGPGNLLSDGGQPVRLAVVPLP